MEEISNHYLLSFKDDCNRPLRLPGTDYDIALCWVRDPNVRANNWYNVS